MKKITRRGFTLIELLVVLFIIGILAALVIVNVNSSRKTARDAKRISDLKSIQSALEMYNEKNGSYPSTVYANATASPCKHSGGSSSSTDWCGLTGYYADGSTNQDWIKDVSTNNTLTPSYLPVLPSDPKPLDAGWLSGYADLNGEYIYKSNGTDYKLRAFGTMETCENSQCTDSANSISIREMVDPCEINTTDYPFLKNTIAVYTSGAGASDSSLWCNYY